VALTDDEQALHDAGASSVPRFLSAAIDETFKAFAKIFGRAKVQIDYWKSQTFIEQAEAPWLDEHARSRGTARQDSETDPALQTRLRTVEDAVTPNAIVNAVNQQLGADGVSGVCGYVELRADRAFFCTFSEDGRKAAYLSRGYRMTTTLKIAPIPMAFPEAAAGTISQVDSKIAIVILPFGTPAATQASVVELLRRKRAAGYPHRIEVRLSP
jgi:hypothetical protein